MLNPNLMNTLIFDLESFNFYDSLRFKLITSILNKTPNCLRKRCFLADFRLKSTFLINEAHDPSYVKIPTFIIVGQSSNSNQKTLPNTMAESNLILSQLRTWKDLNK